MTSGMTSGQSWPVAKSHRLRATKGHARLQQCAGSGNTKLTRNDTHIIIIYYNYIIYNYYDTVSSAIKWCILRGGNEVREICMFHDVSDVSHAS